MTIKYGSVFGNYEWEAEVEITREQAAMLAPLGALQIAQRSPSTAAEKEMAGYEKRPAGFKRTAIPFSPEGAEILQRHQANGLVLGEGDSAITVPATVTVREYVPSEGAESKFVAERAKYAQRRDNLPALAKAVGYDGEVGDGTAENAPMPFLQAIRAWVRAQADKL